MSFRETPGHFENFNKQVTQLDQDRTLLTEMFDSISNRMAGGQRVQAGNDSRMSTRIAEEEAGLLAEDYTPDYESTNGTSTTYIRTGNQAWGDHANGYIPFDQMTNTGGGKYLRSDAAAAWSAMSQAAAKDGITLSINYAYRDYDKQKELYDCYRSGECPNPAAPPGTSNHGWGAAVDIGQSGRRWVQQNGEQFGFLWPQWAREAETYEPWHFNYIGAFNASQDTAVAAEPAGRGGGGSGQPLEAS